MRQEARHGTGSSSRPDDFFAREYDKHDKATLSLLAKSLVGEPDIRKLAKRLHCSTEEELCRKMDCRDLMALFFRGDFFENFTRLQEMINAGRIGNY